MGKNYVREFNMYIYFKKVVINIAQTKNYAAVSSGTPSLDPNDTTSTDWNCGT